MCTTSLELSLSFNWLSVETVDLIITVRTQTRVLVWITFVSILLFCVRSSLIWSLLWEWCQRVLLNCLTHPHFLFISLLSFVVVFKMKRTLHYSHSPLLFNSCVVHWLLNWIFRRSTIVSRTGNHCAVDLLDGRSSHHLHTLTWCILSHLNTLCQHHS